MTNPTIRIHNTETNEVIDREMTADEYAQYQSDEATLILEKKAVAQAATDKAALLAKLGITADEAKLLLS